MPSGQGLVESARQHIGEEYKFVDVPKDDANWRGPWDCAEFISWLVYQEARVLYGCEDNAGDPHKANAWTGYWRRDAAAGRIRVPVEKAAATAGGILLRYPPGVPGKYGHIVLADGKGGTIEAMGRAYGVRAGKVTGRTWHAGILLPEIAYGAADATVRAPGPARVFSINAPNMDPAIVARIQRALQAQGFDPGAIDGSFDQQTLAAVVAFQNAQGLVVDGEVGDETAARLGIDLVAAAAPAVIRGGAAAAPDSATGTQTEGSETMGPLIPIALQLLPGLINLIAGDKTGAFAATINKAVTDIAGTSDSAAAKQKIESDPALAAQLQLKLAQIAADQEEKRNQAQLAALKTQQDAQLAVLKAEQEQDAVRRRDELESFKASLQDIDMARSRAYDAAKGGGPAAWAPIIVSLIVTLGFFGIFIFLVTSNGKLDENRGTFQLVNLTLGALVAAFTTVVSFWLGSSQGSRIKDVATADAAVAQTKELNQTIRAQSATLEKTQSSSIEAVRQATVDNASRIDSIARPAQAAAAPRRSNFKRCLDILLAQEGGFSNRGDDPGGATNYGITLATLNAWLKDRGQPAATVDDVRNLSRDAACEIYRTNFWNVMRCDDLPSGVDLVTFDFGVNAGPGRAAKVLQKAVGAESDGSVGSATIAAAKAARPQDVITSVTQRRLDFYRDLPGFATFGTGWSNRTNQVQMTAMAMANAADAVA